MRTEPRAALSPAVKAVAGTASVFFALLFFAVAWVWCGMSYEEEFSEQSKAVSAGSTMEGWGFTIGLVPVLVLHALIAIGAFFAVRDGGRRRVLLSAMLALALVATVSLPGFVAVQMLYGGTMFAPPVYVP